MTISEIEKEIKNNRASYCTGFVNDFNQVKPKLKTMKLFKEK